MNLFILHNSPRQAAQWNCDRHICKIPIEAGQLLCAAYHLQGISAPYRLSHKNHPTSKFTRASCLNFEWVVEHGIALCEEYTARYGKRHASQDVIEWCAKNSHNLVFDQYDMTDFAIAIAPEMKCRQVEGFEQMSAVEKYRWYYRLDKAHILKYKRNRPDWL